MLYTLNLQLLSKTVEKIFKKQIQIPSFVPQISFFFNSFTPFFTVLGLCCCMQASFSYWEWGFLLCRFPIVVASPVVEHGF